MLWWFTFLFSAQASRLCPHFLVSPDVVTFVSGEPAKRFTAVNYFPSEPGQIFYGTRNGAIQIFDSATGKPIGSLSSKGKSKVKKAGPLARVVASRDGRYIAALTLPQDRSQEVLIWSLVKGSKGLVLRKTIKQLKFRSPLEGICFGSTHLIGISTDEIYSIPFLTKMAPYSLRLLGRNNIRYSNVEASPDLNTLILQGTRTIPKEGEGSEVRHPVIQVYKMSLISGLYERKLNYDFGKLEALREAKVAQYGFSPLGNAPFLLLKTSEGTSERAWLVDLSGHKYFPLETDQPLSRVWGVSFLGLTPQFLVSMKGETKFVQSRDPKWVNIEKWHLHEL